MATFAALSALALSAAAAAWHPAPTGGGWRSVPAPGRQRPVPRGRLRAAATSPRASAGPAAPAPGQPALRLMAGLERQRLAGLHKGTFLCSWQGDPYAAVAAAKAGDPHKAQTNVLFSEAVAGLGAGARDAGWVLVLDAAQATTCQHLAARGVPLSRVLVPNVYTSSVAALRNKGVANAFCCDVQHVLEQVKFGGRAGRRCPFTARPHSRSRRPRATHPSRARACPRRMPRACATVHTLVRAPAHVTCACRSLSVIWWFCTVARGREQVAGRVASSLWRGQHAPVAGSVGVCGRQGL